MATTVGLEATEPLTAGARYDDGSISDAELTALALAAGRKEQPDADAIPLPLYREGSCPLPQWYMPPATATVRKRWRRPVVLTIIAAFFAINALGLCITYGQLVLA